MLVPATLAALPSTRAIPDRGVFYVAEPVSSILDAIGIHMHSLKVAGGIILFLFGSQMLFGKMDEKPGRSPEEGRDLAVEDVNHCVFPLLQTVTCLSIRVSPSLAKVS